jgi:hypothetical protein
MVSRTSGAIALQPTGNFQGGYFFAFGLTQENFSPSQKSQKYETICPSDSSEVKSIACHIGASFILNPISAF